MTAAYPDGNPKTLIGAKKPDLSLVPPPALIHLATAMQNGADKYGPYNWREKRISTRVYIAACMRHLLQFLDGEDFDPISHVHHLGHAMACLAIVLDADEIGMLNDNRPSFSGAAGIMIRQFEENGNLEPPEPEVRNYHN